MEKDQNVGDTLMFIDAIMHGSARRINPGLLRKSVCRQGLSQDYFRHSMLPSRELLARLPPERARIVMSHQPALATNG